MDTKAEKLDTIRKLFAQADDQEGTPEGEAFKDRAMAMLARYGIDETEARRNRGDGPAEIRVIEFRITGRYQSEQCRLLSALADVLHCEALHDRRDRDKTYHLMRLWGAETHAERVRFLFSTLMPRMLAGAERVRPHAGSPVGAKAYRTSWMRGYRAEIVSRLAAAENTATTTANVPGMALVLVDDAQRAEQQMRVWLAKAGATLVPNRTRHVRHDGAAAEMGANAGARANLGQTGVGSRRAIGR